jgi:hypothetical protein
MTGKLLFGCPPGQHYEGKDFIVFVQIHRPRKVAFGTIAAINGFDLALECLNRDEPGHPQHIRILFAFVIAELLVTVTNTQHYP